jgi:hypothetical protein
VGLALGRSDTNYSISYTNDGGGIRLLGHQRGAVGFLAAARARGWRPTAISARPGRDATPIGRDAVVGEPVPAPRDPGRSRRDGRRSGAMSAMPDRLVRKSRLHLVPQSLGADTSLSS